MTAVDIYIESFLHTTTKQIVEWVENYPDMDAIEWIKEVWPRGQPKKIQKVFHQYKDVTENMCIMVMTINMDVSPMVLCSVISKTFKCRVDMMYFDPELNDLRTEKFTRGIPNGLLDK